jgi:hypothetical protein
MDGRTDRQTDKFFIISDKDQTAIDPHWVEMVSAGMLHFGFHPGRFVWWMGGEYTGSQCKTIWALQVVKPHTSNNDYFYFHHILTQDCPHKLRFEESFESKLSMMKRGNQKNFVNNPEIAQKLQTRRTGIIVI